MFSWNDLVIRATTGSSCTKKTMQLLRLETSCTNNLFCATLRACPKGVRMSEFRTWKTYVRKEPIEMSSKGRSDFPVFNLNPNSSFNPSLTPTALFNQSKLHLRSPIYYHNGVASSHATVTSFGWCCSCSVYLR